LIYYANFDVRPELQKGSQMTEENKSLDILGLKPVAESINTITKGTVAGASAFLSLICLPAAEEFGLLLKDQVSEWRANNAIKIANKAQSLLEKGEEKVVVSAPPRIIYSTIEQGSWTEDDLVQSFWAGLLASSCTPDGKDESNLIFINILTQLTTSQVKLINYVCETGTTFKSPGGWITANFFSMEADELKKISGINDLHQLDRELDHLRSLDLIAGGFDPHSTQANVTPSSLCLQLYVRGQGYIGSPIDYFNAKEL
jgi:hypothetical protein